MERSRQNLDQKDPESELRSFETLATEQEPELLKFSRLHTSDFYRYFGVLVNSTLCTKLIFIT